MSEDSNGGMWSSLPKLAKTLGLGGVLLLSGVVVIGLSIYEGPKFSGLTQAGVLVGGFLCGIAIIVLGMMVLRNAPLRRNLKRNLHDVYIAAPMAGFGSDEAARKAAVELVRCVEAALKRVPGIKDVYTPAVARPDATQYETAAAAFDAEFDALHGAARYMLVLPAAIPARTSVLVTAGIAMALKIPCVVLTPIGTELPYLLEGAVQSRRTNVRQHTYVDQKSIEQLIAINGLRLFSDEPEEVSS